MSVFNRIAGTEEPRIGIDRLLLDCIKVMDGVTTVNDLTYPTGFNNEVAPLSQLEKAEVGEYLTALGARIQSLVAAELKGLNVTYRASLLNTDPWYLSPTEVTALTNKAVLSARAMVRSQIEDYLLNGEHQMTTEAEFRSWIGLI